MKSKTDLIAEAIVLMSADDSMEVKTAKLIWQIEALEAIGQLGAEQVAH
jgi:hypothetical protein